VLRAKIRVADGEPGWTVLPDQPVTAREVSFEAVEDGETYEFVLRYARPNGELYGATQVFTHTVVGKSTPPPDVVNLLRRGDELTWSYPSPPLDLAGFRVKSHRGDIRSWEGGLLETPTPLASAPFSLKGFTGLRTLMVKAVDVAGNESVDAALFVNDFGPAARGNIVLTTDYHPGFPGLIVNGAVVGGVLEAAGDGDHWLGTDSALYWTGKAANPVWQPRFKAMVYQANVLPSGPAMLSFDLDIAAQDGWELTIQKALDAPLWSGVDGNAIWSGDDASGWWAATPGVPFPLPGIFEAERQDYTVTLVTAPGTSQARVSGFSAVLDVDDIEERLSGVAVAAAGTRLPIVKRFSAITLVLAQVRDDAGGGVSAKQFDSDPVLGPLFKVLDQAGTPVAGTIDATVIGYDFTPGA
jgi:hypothetical protein